MTSDTDELSPSDTRVAIFSGLSTLLLSESGPIHQDAACVWLVLRSLDLLHPV